MISSLTSAIDLIPVNSSRTFCTFSHLFVRSLSLIPCLIFLLMSFFHLGLLLSVHTGCFATLGPHVGTGANLERGPISGKIVSRTCFARLSTSWLTPVVYFSLLSSALAKNWVALFPQIVAEPRPRVSEIGFSSHLCHQTGHLIEHNQSTTQTHTTQVEKDNV